MMPGRRVLIATGLFTAGAASAAWAAFLASQGLDRADKWSSVAGFVGIVAFGVAGLVVSLRERQNTSNNRAVSPDASINSRAVTGHKPDSSTVAEDPSAEDKPSGGSIFHINAETAYTAHEMTVYNDGSDDQKH
jgi:hypothetical protein